MTENHHRISIRVIFIPVWHVAQDGVKWGVLLLFRHPFQTASAFLAGPRWTVMHDRWCAFRIFIRRTLYCAASVSLIYRWLTVNRTTPAWEERESKTVEIMFSSFLFSFRISDTKGAIMTHIRLSSSVSLPERKTACVWRRACDKIPKQKEFLAESWIRWCHFIN